MNTIKDFIYKWEELVAEKDYLYNFLSVEDAKYIDDHYSFDLNELFNDENYGNIPYLKEIKGKKDIKSKKCEKLRLMLAIRLFIAYKDPHFTEDFYKIDCLKYNLRPMAEMLIYNNSYIKEFSGEYDTCFAKYGENLEKIIETSNSYFAIELAMNRMNEKDIVKYLDSNNPDIYNNAISFCSKETLEKYGVEKLKNKEGALLRLVRKGFFLEEAINSDDYFIVSSAINHNCNFDENQLTKKFSNETTEEFNSVLNAIDCYNLRHGKIKKKYYHNSINILINHDIDFHEYWDYVVKYGDYSNKLDLINKIKETGLRMELLDDLVKDESFQVRIAVAKLGIEKYLDILENDSNEYVNLVVKEQKLQFK